MRLKHPLLTVMVGLLASSSMLNAHAQMSKSEALASLNPEAIQKVKKGSIDLNDLVSNDSNDLIVEYVNEGGSSAKSLKSAEKAANIAASKQAVRKTLASSEYITLRDYKFIPYSFERVSGKASLVALLNDPNVKGVYPNQIRTTQLVQSLPLIQQPAAVSLGYEGEGTSVVVLDTGLDYTRSAFGSCTAPSTTSTTCRVLEAFDLARDDRSLDADGHGTNVSGIVAGVAPKTKLIGIDVFVRKGASDSDILAGLNWTLSNTTKYNIKAVNMSLGGGKYTTSCNSVYTQAFADLRNAGVAPVVASGNDGYTNALSSPACTSGAVAVGAVYDSNMGGIAWSTCTDSTTAADKVTCFSNSSTLVSLLAPGSQITAAGITQSGTSQATPHVAGAIAVLRAANAAPNDTVGQTVNRLVSTGVLITDAKSGLTTPRIDLLAALNSI